MATFLQRYGPEGGTGQGRHKGASWVWVFVILFAATFSLGASELRRSAIVRAVEKASPAVVNVNSDQAMSGRSSPFRGFLGDSFFDEFFRDFLAPQPRGQTSTSLGSGVVIDKRGFILTNQHVCQGASRIRVTLADRREFVAKLIGADPPSDLAVLRVDTKEDLPVIPMGRSDDLMIGETVIAIGNPFGLSHTVTTGVISALNRSVRTEPRVYQDFIQTDAAINPGNSGGPLLNIDGELIGINTAIYQKAQGVGFAIPIDRAKRIVQDLIHYGEVHAAWIGLEVQDLDDHLAKALGLEGKGGVLVTDVVHSGPADRAGIRKGDLITALGQRPTTSRKDFLRALSAYTATSGIAIRYIREGRVREATVMAEALTAEQAMKEAEARLGLAVGPVTGALRRELGLSWDAGVVVVSVQPEGLAHRSGIRRGDLIRQVNDREVSNLQEYQKAMAAALRRENVLLLIQRGAFGYYLTLEMGEG
ncbi:MAG: Do family serine endopeptidase [Thermodesulfobacteriota bacterium]